MTRPPPKSLSSAAPTPGRAQSLYLESSPPRSSCDQPLLTINPTVKLSSSAQEDRLGLLTGFAHGFVYGPYLYSVVVITVCLTHSRCLISICQVSEVTWSSGSFQRLCLHERASLSSGTSLVLNTLTSMVARSQVRCGTLLFPLGVWHS